MNEITYIMTTHKSKSFRSTEEARLQKECEVWLTLNGYKFVHVPGCNQRYIWGTGRGSVPPQVAVAASRYLKGVPDLLIYDKVNEGGPVRAWIVELKSERGKPTPEQLEWQGFGMRVVRSLDELMKVILCTK